MIELNFPAQVTEIVKLLNAGGYQAYPVGECVRDLLLGYSPMDYDIITNAPIDRFETIFSDYPTNTEKIYRGEIIVQVLGMAILVAPFRSGFDGQGYPIFTRNVVKDLARRGFAMNAIAYKIGIGTIDPFHGAACLDSTPALLVAVGKGRQFDDEGEFSVPPDYELPKPFENNPDSVAEALIYYGSGEYNIEGGTAEAIRENVNSLAQLPPESKAKQLEKLIMSKRIATLFDEYSAAFTALVPELDMMLGFDQRSKYQQYSLWEHTAKALSYCPPNLSVRFAALFHGIGKPDCYAFRAGDTSRAGVYSGHAVRSAIYARRILTELKYSDDFIDDVCLLIENHDTELPVERDGIRRTMNRFGLLTRQLYQLEAANFRAKSRSGEIVGSIFKKISESI